MGWLKHYLHSSIGSKTVMALTGVALFGFLVGHLGGNLITYKGADAFNTYAQGMQNLGALLWVARIGLLVLLILHVVGAFMLTKKNRTARPVAYHNKKYKEASFASRTMIMTGLFVLFFLIYHLMHFTFYTVGGDIHHFQDAQGRHDAFKMFVLGFQNPIAAGSYVAAMIVLGLHLSHGLSSIFQSFGLNHPHFNKLWRCGGPLIAWTLAAGFISLPVSVWLGVIRLAEGG